MIAENPRFFPMFVNMERKKVLVVGAGKIALRRILTLLSFRASIYIVAKEIPKDTKEEMEKLIQSGQVHYLEQAFAEECLTEDIDIVLAATDNSCLNEIIYHMCKERRILVNTSSDRKLCDFWFPAVALGEDITVGIAGDGKNHKKTADTAAAIRQFLKEQDEHTDPEVTI